MHRVWAVATNTIRQALRMKVAAVFIVLLLVLLPVMGATATGDGTLKGRLQTVVAYGMSLTSLLLSLLTIIVATYSITSDIEQRQIYTVVTKPIRRYQLILGKFLGVVVLDVALLTLFLGIVYGVIVLMPRFVTASEEERAQIHSEFFTARASLIPPLVDVSQEVDTMYRWLEKEDKLGVLYPNYAPEEIKKLLTKRIQLERRASTIGQMLIWEFQNVRPTDPNTQSLFIRFKYDVSVTPPDEHVYGDWRIGDLRGLKTGTAVDTPVYRVAPRRDPVRKFREIEVPARAVAKDGYLAVAFVNPPLNDTTVLFPIEDGLEVLYKADSFAANYVRAGLLILFRLVFLACLGVMAASFLSFPVAILFCLVIFVMGAASGFFVESFGYMNENVGRIYTYTIQNLIRLLPRFDSYNPTQYLIPARLISWRLIGEVVLIMVCLKAALLLVLSLVIFRFRELAKVVV